MSATSDWFRERNERLARERRERREQLQAQGFRLIPWLAIRVPRTGMDLMSSWFGETEQLVITNLTDDNLETGLGMIAVGPDSEIYINPAEPFELARERNGAVLTVFKGTRPM